MSYYRYHVFCCTNIRPETDERGSCGGARGAALRNHLKAQAKEAGLEDVRINTAGCLGRCEEGPVVVVYPEGIWYGVRSTEDMDAILESHLSRGIPIESLRLPDHPDDAA